MVAIEHPWLSSDRLRIDVEVPLSDIETGERPVNPEEQPGRQPAALRRYSAAVTARALRSASVARKRLLLLAPAAAALIAAYILRQQLFGADKPVRLVIAGVMIAVGWALATNLGRAVEPRLVRHVNPGAAAVGRFVIRLMVLAAIAVFSLKLAGLDLKGIAAGATVTGIVLGLAAQQTIGNVIAGTVLLSSRPFQVGDRVRFNGFGMDVEGTVASYGLLYVTMADGDDLVLVPNGTALTMSVRPLREPTAVDMTARFPASVDPEAVESRVVEEVTVQTRARPQISLESFDGETVVVRIRARPEHSEEGGKLARQVLRALSSLHEDGLGPPHTGAHALAPSLSGAGR